MHAKTSDRGKQSRDASQKDCCVLRVINHYGEMYCTTITALLSCTVDVSMSRVIRKALLESLICVRRIMVSNAWLRPTRHPLLSLSHAFSRAPRCSLHLRCASGVPSSFQGLFEQAVDLLPSSGLLLPSLRVFSRDQNSMGIDAGP